MSNKNRSKNRCNTGKSHSLPPAAVETEIRVISDDVVTIPREEYVRLIRQSVENDIMRNMLAEEEDSFGLYKSMKQVLSSCEEEPCE